MTPDNPYMPQVIRDAIVPGAAAEYFEDPDTPDGVLVTRDNYDLGVNAEDTVRETLRGVLAANGNLSDHLRYEASYVYGETKSEIVENNNRFEDDWLAAIDVVSDPITGVPVCRSSLDPDPAYSPAACRTTSSAMESAIRARPPSSTPTASRHTKVTQQVVSGSLSGDFGFIPGTAGRFDRLRGRRGIPARNQRLRSRRRKSRTA